MTFRIGLVYSSREIMTIGKGLFKRKIIYIMFLLNRKKQTKTEEIWRIRRSCIEYKEHSIFL